MRFPWWTRVMAGSVAVAISAFLITSIIQPRRTPPPQLKAGQHLPVNTAAIQPPQLCTELYRTICGTRGETRDPTGGVTPDVQGELNALRTYEHIIREHPDWTSEQVDEELVRIIYTPERRARLDEAYRWVLNAMEKLIDRQPGSVFTDLEKTQLRQRLRSTELQLPPPISVYADEPDLLTKNDVFYERSADGQTRMRVGGAFLLNSKSWFNLVFTFAHEFSHAIDPCELRAAGLVMPAYDRLNACFLSQGLIAARKSRRECGENDQLSETFADWLAVQISAEALKHFATEFTGTALINAATNSVRDLCEQDDGDVPDLAQHPSPQTRIELIFGRHPQIRDFLGCAPEPDSNPIDYCSFDFTPNSQTM